MAEFVHQHHLEGGMVTGGEGYRVEDAPSAVLAGVHEDYDVLERHPCQFEVQGPHVGCGEISVGVESVVMGRHVRVLPHLVMGDAHPGILRDGSHRHEIETVRVALERFVFHHGRHRPACVGIEFPEIPEGVSVPDYGDVYTLVVITPAHELPEGILGLERPYEYVRRVNGVGERGTDAAVLVAQRYAHRHRFPGPWNLEAVLEPFVYRGSLFSVLPLLEQSGE